MRIAQAVLASLLITSTPSLVLAQEDDPADLEVVEEDEPEAPPAEEDVAPAPAAEREAEPAAAAASTPPQEDTFLVRHGFWTQADLGVFFTLGGANFDLIEGKKGKGISNVQPYVGLSLGYDIAYSESFQFALGLKLGAGYSSGAGRVKDDDIVNKGDDAATMSSDFAIYEAGLLAKIGFFVSQRVAINIALDGGAGFLDPNPYLAATEDGAGGMKFAPTFGGALGFEYYTLLNDFSVGLDIRGSLTLGDDAIPGLGVTIPMRYTF